MDRAALGEPPPEKGLEKVRDLVCDPHAYISHLIKSVERENALL